jgi:hypothetical protein
MESGIWSGRRNGITGISLASFSSLVFVQMPVAMNGCSVLGDVGRALNHPANQICKRWQGSRAAGQPKWWVYGAVLAACPDIVMDDHDGGETRRARTG